MSGPANDAIRRYRETVRSSPLPLRPALMSMLVDVGREMANLGAPADAIEELTGDGALAWRIFSEANPVARSRARQERAAWADESLRATSSRYGTTSPIQQEVVAFQQLVYASVAEAIGVSRPGDLLPSWSIGKVRKSNLRVQPIPTLRQVPPTTLGTGVGAMLHFFVPNDHSMSVWDLSLCYGESGRTNLSYHPGPGWLHRPTLAVPYPIQLKDVHHPITAFANLAAFVREADGADEFVRLLAILRETSAVINPVRTS